ncbi:MAG: hypothetical protein HC875_13755 [Anaerolineales bacterium]|nr:hypothetical protein [Anaerolineales bacterium]
MLKTLLRPFLGRGKLPADVRPTLEAEGIHFLEEGLWGTITYHNYRAPGRYSAWRKRAFVGALVLTSKRVMACWGRERLLDITFDHPLLAAVKFSLEKPDCLLAAYDAARFHTDRSGQVEVRFSTPQAGRIMELLRPHLKGASDQGEF